MSIDAIGDFLTIIRNGVMVSRPFVLAPASKMRLAIANILLEEGFIRAVDVVEQDGKNYLKVYLKYVDGESAIHEIQRISKPSRRTYTSIAEIKPVIGGLGLSILTTNRGVMSHKRARQENVGGELICTVW